MQINLIDESFRHLANSSGRYSMVHGKKPRYISWTRDRMKYDGVTIFTDVHLNPDSISRVESKKKIGWFIENRAVVPSAYLTIESYIGKLDYIFTNDSMLLLKYPEKAKFVPFGGSWVKKENIGIKSKNKLISMIYSNKNQFKGHKLRHEIAEELAGKVDLFGTGASSPIEFKEQALSDYMYTIVVENVSAENYFTEKIVDPILLGTVPLYWGCPNIENFFMKDAIIKFKTIEELRKLVETLNEETYNSAKSGIGVNYDLGLQYEVTEDWLYENILKSL